MMFDVDLELKDSGLVDSDEAGQVSGSDQILDLGTGLVTGNMVVDVESITIDSSADQNFKISLQGSSKSDFADTIEDLAILELGSEATLGTPDVDSTTGRYIVPFRTERNGTTYQYCRVYCDVSGTIGSGEGINYSAYLSK